MQCKIDLSSIPWIRHTKIDIQNFATNEDSDHVPIRRLFCPSLYSVYYDFYQAYIDNIEREPT